MLLVREATWSEEWRRRGRRDAHRSTDADTAAMARTRRAVGVVRTNRLRQPLAGRSLRAAIQTRRPHLRALDAPGGTGSVHGARSDRRARFLQHLPPPAAASQGGRHG